LYVLLLKNNLIGTFWPGPQTSQNSIQDKIRVRMSIPKQDKPVDKKTGNQQDTEAKKKDAQLGDRSLFETRPEAGHGPAPGRLWRRGPSLNHQK
jgi:hypothetical protein